MKVLNVFRNRFVGHMFFVRRILLLLYCLGFLLIMTTDTAGRPFRLEKIPDQGKHFKCKTCHASRFGGKTFNPFGLDYKEIGLAAGDSYTDELAELDSDSDGFTNRQEFDEGTNPGDPKSKPER